MTDPYWLAGAQLDLERELAADMYCDEVIDGSGRLLYLDTVVSVSALAEAESRPWDDELLEKQYRRFLHGS